MQIAHTILTQLGGNRFLVMTGSKNLTAIMDGLRMKLTRNKIGAQYFTVILAGDDTYTLKFSKVNGKSGEVTILEEMTGVCAEDLQRLFTEVTGLYTKL